MTSRNDIQPKRHLRTTAGYERRCARYPTLGSRSAERRVGHEASLRVRHEGGAKQAAPTTRWPNSAQNTGALGEVCLTLYVGSPPPSTSDVGLTQQSPP